MKCTNCGKNNAVSHFRYEVNGRAAEAHLCADCARQLMPELEPASVARELFGDMGGFGLMDSLFGGMPGRGTGGLLDSFFGGSLFSGPFAAFAPLSDFGVPRIEITFPDTSARRQAGEPEERKPDEVDDELSHRRQVNALREQMRSAAEREDYEEAARIRDELKKLEDKKPR